MLENIKNLFWLGITITWLSFSLVLGMFLACALASYL